jgi:hypothetical protein
MFENPLIRFATSGTLITCYAVADVLARRRIANEPSAPTPRWVRPMIVIVMAAFYCLIGPTGGALLGGIANWAGVALVGLAIAIRSSRVVRYPSHAGRGLFYLALPLAVGVPWGLLVMSLPACAASGYRCHCAERLGASDDHAEPSATPLPRFRMIPGVW